VSESSVLTCVTSATCVVSGVAGSWAWTCVSGAILALSFMLPSSSDPMGLGKYGGDSGVVSESWVWRESVEDDGSRSGQGFWRDALYIVLSVRSLRQSCGP